jgi:hypothetical protein
MLCSLQCVHAVVCAAAMRAPVRVAVVHVCSSPLQRYYVILMLALDSPDPQISNARNGARFHP